ncbi:cadherin repeat domain-containing protein [Planctomicrobium piriforme]|uniref:Cadherin domain-containing protein n=1 Tax=Planctomicrobium piriforme TaxID=1576369 RepID=A0A1I3FDT9_9PLAN|nr:cadherin repeat domain-containing protein [Planctomicrobium piriforme]SFI09369.1 Cadherin domain-containing protein [Planctomicrobium piriforme]
MVRTTLFAGLLRHWRSQSRSRQRRRDGRQRSWRTEGLEARTLLSAAPNGAESLAHAPSDLAQTQPAVATYYDGSYIIAWQSDSGGGDGFDIYAQNYLSDGAPYGNAIRVNTTTIGNQTDVAIAFQQTGESIIISWVSEFQDGSGAGIFARRFTSLTNPLGGEFQVNTYTTGAQVQPAIAADFYGNFVITWASFGQDGNGYGVYAQRYNAAGTSLGSEFKVNTYTTKSQSRPAVAMDYNGEFVIAWQSAGQDGSGYGVYSQRYSSGGTAQGGQVRANGRTTGHQMFPSVARDNDGDFVIAWSSYGQDGSNNGVYAKRYNDFGTLVGSEFRVNRFTADSQSLPSVAMNPDGDFVIAWTSAGQDGDGQGVYAQLYSPSGVAQGSEQQVNTSTPGDQTQPVVALSNSGNFVVGWTTDNGGANEDVLTQRFAPVPDIVEVLALGRTLAESELLIAPISSLIVAFAGSMATTGAASVTDSSNWLFTKNGVDADQLIAGISYKYVGARRRFEATVTFTTALTPGDYTLTARDTLTDINGNQLDGDASGVDGGNFVRNFQLRTPRAVGPEHLVNTTTVNDQVNPSVAMDAAGNYVMVWKAAGEIAGQRFNAAGQPQGAEFRVNTYTTNVQEAPAVAMDSAGNFVVTWESNAQDGDGEGIYAQRFDAVGNRLGGEFQVNTYTVDTQETPAIAMTAAGEFVITWTSFAFDGSSDAVAAQRYAANGSAVGTEFLVNAYTTSSQSDPDVAIDAAGNMVFAWSSNGQDGSFGGIFASRFDWNAVRLGAEFAVNTITGEIQSQPSVAMDAVGNFVIAWTDDSFPDTTIQAQRFAASGQKQGNNFVVSATAVNQREPVVAMDASGDFVIAWTNADAYDIYAKRFNAVGVPQGLEFRVNSYATSFQEGSAIAMSPEGDFVVAWNSTNPLDGSGYGVFAQRYSTQPDVTGVFLPVGPAIVPGVEYSTSFPSLTIGFPVGMSNFGPGNVASASNWLLKKDNVDVTALIASINYSYNALRRQYEATAVFNAPLAPGDYQLTLKESAKNVDARPIDGNNDAVAGGSFVQTFQVRALGLVGPETHSSATADDYIDAQIVQSPSGAGLILYTRAVGGSSAQDVYAQRIDASGAPVGSEFRVNTSTTSIQRAAAAAIDAAGNFVVTWQSESQGSSDSDIYAQFFDAAGTPRGSEFRVNTNTSNYQLYPSVAMDAAGDYVIAWQTFLTNTSSWEISAQRYSSSGAAQGGEFRVNTTLANFQTDPEIAMNDSGDYVITWQSEGQEGALSGIYAQRYNSDGVAQGGEFRVNTTLQYSHFAQDVVMDPAGNFIVTWESYTPSGDPRRIDAQRFNAAGVKQGPEFQVNSSTADRQANPQIAMNPFGEFVISWQSRYQDGSAYGIYAQRYSSVGTAQGTEFRVNSFTTGSQSRPAVAMDAFGGFTMVWSSDDQDGLTSSIRGQRYGAVVNQAPTNITLSNSSVAENQGYGTLVGNLSAIDPNFGDTFTYVLVSGTGSTDNSKFVIDNGNQLKTTVTLDYETTPTCSIRVRVTDAGGLTYEKILTITVVDGNEPPVLGALNDTITYTRGQGAKIVDTNATVTDADSANFNGGYLNVYLGGTGQAGDEMSVKHHGNAAGQIGVSGNNISYGGVLIATMSPGNGMVALTINFLATATPEAVQALVRRVTFNTTSMSQTMRTMTFTLDDADGGMPLSVSKNITIF